MCNWLTYWFDQVCLRSSFLEKSTRLFYWYWEIKCIYEIHVMTCTCSLQFELMNTKSAYTCWGAYIQLKLDENILCRKETEVVLDRYVCCAQYKASYTIYRYCIWTLHQKLLRSLMLQAISNWREGYLLSTWAGKITCRHFNWMLQSSSEWKWRSANKLCYL